MLRTQWGGHEDDGRSPEGFELEAIYTQPSETSHISRLLKDARSLGLYENTITHFRTQREKNHSLYGYEGSLSKDAMVDWISFNQNAVVTKQGLIL